MKRSKSKPHQGLQRRLPLNIPLELVDGRMLIIKNGSGKEMTARQKQARRSEPIHLDEIVRVVPGKTGRGVLLRAINRTKKDIRFEILGEVTDELDG
jgi:hypothetical protein